MNLCNKRALKEKLENLKVHPATRLVGRHALFASFAPSHVIGTGSVVQQGESNLLSSRRYIIARRDELRLEEACR